MARPRQDAGEPAARERICEAFWSLLEGCTYPEMSVGMLVSEAGCNRGTFYYHYDSLDALATELVTREMLAEGSLPFFLCEVLSGGRMADEARSTLRPHVRRLSLMTTSGGMGIVVPVMRDMLSSVWEKVFGLSYDQLSLDARIAIEYCGAGMIGLLANSSLTEEAWYGDTSETSFTRKNFEFLVSCIGEAQGIGVDELGARLRQCRVA